MAIHTTTLLLLNLLLFIAPINGSDLTRKLDENPVPVTGDPNEKCTPCEQIPPPPPPPPPVYPPPPPPPDTTPYYSPPPPKKKEPKNNCPPPPSPSFMYITGPPGDLYPIDQNYDGAGPRIFPGFLAVFGCALLGFLAV